MIYVDAARAAAAGSLLALLGAVGLVSAAPAQCALEWLPGPGIVGVDDDVHAIAPWDPDGSGPAPAKLVVAGDFRGAGHVAANRVAAWDPVAGWQRLGSGTNGAVHAVRPLANGDLVVGGSFTVAGGLPARSIARWDGAVWSPLGPGVSGTVRDLAILPNGDLVAVGSFQNIGVPGSNVARWDGSGWSPLGSGTQAAVRCVAVLPNGDVVVGGDFTSIGGVAANRVARWDGAAWTPLGAGLAGGASPGVWDLEVMPNGDLIAGGRFSTAGAVAATHVARWDGAAWSPVAGGFAFPPASLHVRANGGLIAVASLASGPYQLLEWTGTTWTQIAPPPALPHLVTTLPGGDLFTAGGFVAVQGVVAERVARWDGAAWSGLAAVETPWFVDSTDVGPSCVVTAANGDVIVGGSFTAAGAVSLSGVGRFDGASWSPLGSGVASWPVPYPFVLAVEALPNGDVAVGGVLTSAGGAPAGHVALWNGAAWSSMAGGVDDRVLALEALPNGDLIVAGAFTVAGGVAANHVARWGGGAWSPLGSGTNGAVRSVLAMPNGDLLVAGDFTAAGGVVANGVARWDGAAWSPLGGGHPHGVSLLRRRSDGDVIACFLPPPPTILSTVARWDGSSWSPFGGVVTGWLHDLVPLPNGDLIAAGQDNNGPVFVRGDGASWSTIAGPDGLVSAVATLPDGALVAAGSFASAGPYLSRNLARLRATCPATATAVGVGCPSSGGGNALAAATLPWTGGTFRAVGTGLPTLALVSQVWGFQPTQLALSSILPQALPGCDLLVSPDHVVFSLTTTGDVTTGLEIPANAALAGLQVHHQLNLFEVTPALTIVAVTASNALELTIGVF